MSQSGTSAVNVGDGEIEPKSTFACDILGCEGLVDLYQLNVLEAHAALSKAFFVEGTGPYPMRYGWTPEAV